ncbi:DUF2207 domain-containing protein [Leptotrichia sp. oral taxon 223]|uniref:DUF2207 domain-containing protein n=1 Tax=Leptotrichia sp. oral taxon 223 TaxID=712363 RepID=UPI0015BF7685|nr:DUF2207 domain-containing protein [Leptotrichia sp. oral taxon 223]NWO19640.1 DUF2207 domain-containing protein [Leptotrichia sp. oral taxon 223]
MKSFNKQKLNSIFSIIFVFFTLFFLNTKSLIAEKITNYDVTVQINKNGTLTVNEVIDYEFDGAAKHGIYRDIPLRSKKNGVDIYKCYIKMNSIKRNGLSEEYSTKNFNEGVRYRVGSADRFVENGVNRYEFNYVIYNAVFEKDGIYQVYFNAIGQFWKVPIEKATVNIKFGNGKPVTENEINKLDIFTGEYGQNGKDYIENLNNGTIEIKTNKVLQSYNGLSFRLNLKTNNISPTFLDKLQTLYYAHPLLAAGPVIIIFLAIYGFVTWYIFGRDVGKKAIVPEFNIPKDISAMYAAYIKGVREPKEILTIGVLSLLSKGYVEADDKKGDGKNVKYTLSDSKRSKPKLAEEEKIVFNALSDTGNIFKNEKSLYKASNKILKLFENEYKRKVYRDNSIFNVAFIIGIVIVFIISTNANSGTEGLADNNFEVAYLVMIGCVFGIILNRVFLVLKNIYGSKSTFLKVVKWLVVLFMSAIYGVLNFIVIGIIMAMYTIYSKVIGRYTADGMRKKEYLDGMKMYIKTAEANQIMKFNDVDELVAYFKGILPYAVALGVKNEAIKLMKNTIKLYNFDESTYSYINRGVHFNTYDSFILANTVSRVYNNAYNKIREERFSTLRNDSGSSSGSGFGGGGFSSGGGFSGGGSGGGGGGSW